MQKVIFREEFDPYTEEKGFLAIFPEDEANSGCVAVIPFRFRDKRPWYEPYSEASIDYVLSKKIIHKNDERIPALVEAIEKRIEDQVQVVEKMMR